MCDRKWRNGTLEPLEQRERGMQVAGTERLKKIAKRGKRDRRKDNHPLRVGDRVGGDVRHNWRLGESFLKKGEDFLVPFSFAVQCRDRVCSDFCHFSVAFR